MSGKAIRETLAALGVIASMVFVGLEIRQNRIAAQASAYQDLGLAVSSAIREASMNREFAELMRNAADSTRWDQIDDVGWTQVSGYIIGQLRSRETLFRLVESGALPQDAMTVLGYDNAGEQYGHGLIRLWPRIRQGMSADFVAVLEERGFGQAIQ